MIDGAFLSMLRLPLRRIGAPSGSTTQDVVGLTAGLPGKLNGQGKTPEDNSNDLALHSRIFGAASSSTFWSGGARVKSLNVCAILVATRGDHTAGGLPAWLIAG